jgi:hypothetical protein
MLYSGNLEPSIEELLDDPIVVLIMARDRITPEIVWFEIAEVRQKLERRRCAGSRSPAHSLFEGA